MLVLYSAGLMFLGVIFCAFFLEAGLRLGPDQLAELIICVIWMAPLLLAAAIIAAVVLFLPLYKQGGALQTGEIEMEKAVRTWKQLMFFPAVAMFISMAVWIAGTSIICLWMLGKGALSAHDAVPAAACCALLGMTTAIGFYFCARHTLRPVLARVCEFLPSEFTPVRTTKVGTKQFGAFIFILAAFSICLLTEAYFLMNRTRLDMTLSIARERLSQGMDEEERLGEFRLRPFTVSFEGGFTEGQGLSGPEKQYIRNHHRLLRHSRWLAEDSLKSALTAGFSSWIELPDYVIFNEQRQDDRAVKTALRQWILMQREPAAGGLHPGVIIERETDGPLAGGSTNILFLALFFATLMFAAFIYSRWICRDVLRPINDLASKVKDAAESRQTAIAPVTTDDEIGELTASFNRMNVVLENQMQGARETLNSIGEAVQDLGRIMENLSSVSSEQAADATEHATSMQEVTSTSEEIAATLRSIAENAQNVEEVAGKSLSSCRSGQEQLEEVITELDTAGSRSSELGMRMLSLQEQANRIEGILKFIQEISEKTNLIALNASIEASAVSDEEQRFPIIAQEMRKLAEKTLSGAKEIRSVLEDLQEATGKAIISTEEGEKKVGAARESSEKAAEHFQSIIHWAGETSRAAQEIAISSNQQTSATDHLASALGEIKDVASRFADGTTHLNNFMNELKETATKLEKFLEKDGPKDDNDQ